MEQQLPSDLRRQDTLKNTVFWNETSDITTLLPQLHYQHIPVYIGAFHASRLENTTVGRLTGDHHLGVTGKPDEVQT